MTRSIQRIAPKAATGAASATPAARPKARTPATRSPAAKAAAVNDTGTLKQVRALATRRQLVRAARTVFARDGFEHARLADIAAAAGKTRGAFYDHFQDKEDVFFAIFEDDLEQYRETVRPAIAKLDHLEQRIGHLVNYLVAKSRNRQKMLLALEFKIYAIRHPRRRERLADLHAAMCRRCALPELEHPFTVHSSGGRPSRAESLAIGALMDGFALNRLFDPGTLDEAQMRRYLLLAIVDALQVPSP